MRNLTVYYLLAIVIFLLGFGVFFLSTLSAVKSWQIFGNTNYYLVRHLIKISIGLGIAFAAFKISLPFLKKIAPALLGFNLLLLLAVLLFGASFGGAKRWISIGGFVIQPSEFLKITVILYLAALISGKIAKDPKKGWISAAKKGYHNFARIFLPFLAMMALTITILYFQKDLGTLGIVIIILLSVYFASGTPFWHMLMVALLATGSAVIFVFREQYRINRLKVFLNPETDPLGIGHQLTQSLIAIGSGGIIGKGLGMSVQKFGFLPQAMDDSIFAIIGEETGFVGAGVLVIMFLLFYLFGMKIAKSADDKFSSLAAIGITVWIAGQSFMNIASSIGIIPLTGIPLPFFSYGGSHIIAELIGTGILFNIAKNNKS